MVYIAAGENFDVDRLQIKHMLHRGQIEKILICETRKVKPIVRLCAEECPFFTAHLTAKFWTK